MSRRNLDMGGVLVFWEVWQKNIVKCEETKILALNVKVKKEMVHWRKQILANDDS